VFAWALEREAPAVRAGMVAAFERHGLATDSWQAVIEPAGARVVSA
jgi:hypothetical protein